MNVRHYIPEDAAALIALKRDTICRVNSRDYNEEQVRAWAPDDTAILHWQQRVANRFVVVAEEDGRVAGFGDVGPDGHIDQFYVHADSQRRGVGRAILTALISEAQGCGTERLFSEVSITARPFFEAHGFRVDAEQVVVARGVQFTNFRMSRQMTDG